MMQTLTAAATSELRQRADQAIAAAAIFKKWADQLETDPQMAVDSLQAELRDITPTAPTELGNPVLAEGALVALSMLDGELGADGDRDAELTGLIDKYFEIVGNLKSQVRHISEEVYETAHQNATPIARRINTLPAKTQDGLVHKLAFTAEVCGYRDDPQLFDGCLSDETLASVFRDALRYCGVDTSQLEYAEDNVIPLSRPA